MNFEVKCSLPNINCLVDLLSEFSQLARFFKEKSSNLATIVSDTLFVCFFFSFFFTHFVCTEPQDGRIR